MGAFWSAQIVRAGGHETGGLHVVVEISDIDGDTGRDSVRVAIGN